MKLELVINEPGTIGGSMSFGEIDTTALKDVPEEELTQRLKKVTEPQMGLLPAAVRWISHDKKLVVFERPPMYSRLEYIPAMREEITAKSKSVAMNMPMPWTVYLVYFSDDFVPVHIRMFARNEPIQDMNSTLGLLPILNFYSNGELCNPIFERYEDFEPSLANGINAAYNMVWNSGFNYDLSEAQNLGRLADTPAHIRDIMRRGTLYNRFATDAVSGFYLAWESLSMSQVLATNWHTPWHGRRTTPLGNGELTLSLRYALQIMQEELQGEYPKNAQTFMVNLVNTISSI